LLLLLRKLLLQFLQNHNKELEMNTLSRFSVNNPVTILMFVMGVLLLGFISYGKLGTDLFPDLNNPKIFIEISAGERPPEEIESQFVESIESNAMRQKNVVQVSSISRIGSALITVEYSWETDMDEAFLDLQKALTTFNQNSDLEEFNITRHNPNAKPVMLVALRHTDIQDMNELRKVAENYIRNELIRLEGIADIQLSGQQEIEIVVKTNEYLLKAHNISAETIASKIQSFNRNVSGGSVVDKGMQYIIKGVSVLEDIEDFGNIVVSYQTTPPNNFQSTQKVPIYLKDVAQIEAINKDPLNIVHINGMRCIGLSIYKETKYNTVKAVDDLLLAFSNIQKALPGYEFTVIQNQGSFISEAIGEVQNTALIGIVLAIVVLFVFLRRIGTTFIVSIAIPISIIATFNLMYFNNLSLNIMTLGGLALGAGMLVDNAIVVIENIFRNIEEGMSVKDAAIVGTSEVGGAITGSTLTAIVVFLPIVYLHGASGELFKDQAWTVAFSLISSLFVAVFVIPVLFNSFFKNKAVVVPKETIKFVGYNNLLIKILNKRWWVIIVSFGLTIASVGLIPLIGSEYMPKSEANEFTIDLKMPEGTKLERTSAAMDNIEKMVQSIAAENVAYIYSHAGPDAQNSGASGIFQDENTGYVKVILKPEAKQSISQIINQLGVALENIPEVEIQISQSESALQEILGTDEVPLVVEVVGAELSVIDTLSSEVKILMSGIENVFNVKTSIEQGAPEIEVVIDRYRAGLYNINVDNITSQIKDKLSGKEAGQFEKNGEMSDIVLKFPEVSLLEFANMTVQNGEQQIRLDEIAQIRSAYAPKEINRRNQNRIAKITAEVNPNIPFDHIVAQLEKQLQQIDLPADYKIQIAGEEEKRKESMNSLTFALILSVVLVYMVLASQFESLIHPFTILLTIPLAFVGALLAFFILGMTLNIMAFIGIIMLAGIAVNNAIILLDRTIQLQRSGTSFQEAITLSAQQRIRPILMNSLANVLGLLPLTFGFGESASLRAPMAVAVIGGLITSTILSLVVIPCVYYVFEEIKMRIKRR